MKTFKEYVNEGINVISIINKDNKIYQLAMRAKDSKDLKDKTKLALNKKGVKTDKVNWEEVFKELNEKIKNEAPIL